MTEVTEKNREERPSI